jgi:acetylornithine deacetylase/succinyl-diaminopimelate desuccinylase-like protein
MPASPNWDSAAAEAIDILCRYIRVDTSNPPGREKRACDFLGEILRAEGIEYQLFDAGGDERWSLRAVLKGDGTARPFMLLNHTDVVPVQREYWDHDPFIGEVIDGHIWGRGALDMKGLGVAQLLTFLSLKRLGVPLKRDVVFFAMADEEAGSEFGMHWFERNHPEALDAEYVLNEGGGGTTELFGVERAVFSVAVSEKGPLWLRLVAEGKPGHASMPHDDNALDRLVRALHRVQTWERALEVSPLLTEYFSRLQRAGIYKGQATVEGLSEAAKTDIRIRAALMDTISATMASAGIKHNVIPGRAEATLDIRLLPGRDPDAFQAEVVRVIDDPRVTVERVYARTSDANSIETELFAVIEDVVHEHLEDAVVVPSVTVGFTDSAILRNRGQVSYGFSGSLSKPELMGGVHGHNERIAVESLRLSCQMVYEVTRRMCQAES